MSTPFAAKVRLAPVAVMVTFLTVPGVVLSCPVKVMKSKLAVPGRTTMIDATALSVVNGALVPSIVLGATTNAAGMTRVGRSDRQRAKQGAWCGVFRDGEVVVKLSPVMVRGLLGVGNETDRLLKSMRAIKGLQVQHSAASLAGTSLERTAAVSAEAQSQVMVGSPQTYETTS